MRDLMTHMPDQLCVGHLAIDAQHEILYALYNEVTSSLACQETNFDLRDIFAGLTAYISMHFRFEEDLMLESRYPGREAQLKEHHQLEESVRALHGRFVQAGDAAAEMGVARETEVFLKEWLGHHINELDRELARYLHEHGHVE
ncbi:MAG: hemerythrin domain-containing protein [Magnetococcus sp. MYC-9]